MWNWSSDYLAGIQQPVRIQGFLEPPHQLDFLGAAILVEPCAFRDAHSVLRTETAAELGNQIVNRRREALDPAGVAGQ